MKIHEQKVGSTKRAIRTRLTSEGDLDDFSSAASVKFRMTKEGETIPKVYATGALETVNARYLVVRYDWTAQDVDTAGIFHAEWEITFSDNPQRFETFPSDGYDIVKFYNREA